VIPIFLQQRDSGMLTITDERMTRFWLTLEQGVRFVIRCTEQMRGGEVFVPKIPSTKIADIAKVIAPDANWEIIGIRPGEKLHEVLINEDEARSTVETDDMYVVQPSGSLWFGHEWQQNGKSLESGFRYSSDKNPQWLTVDQITELIAPFETRTM
jgi:UDP-N-acetylglucosamine 4,6-dehydratase